MKDKSTVQLRIENALLSKVDFTKLEYSKRISSKIVNKIVYQKNNKKC